MREIEVQKNISRADASVRVMVSLEYRFIRCPEGYHYADQHYDYSFWERYLQVFDGVVVLARCTPVSKVEAGWRRVEGEGVEFQEIPMYRGPVQFLLKYRQILKVISDTARATDCMVLRISSGIGVMVARHGLYRDRPLAVEVVGDPLDALASGNVRSVLRPFARRAMFMAQRRLCRLAQASAYVTKETLQQRYPPASGAFTTNYSSVQLPDDAYIDEPRVFEAWGDRRPEILFIGSLSVSYKGLDDLVEAMAFWRDRGGVFHLKVLGGGGLREKYEQKVAAAGLSDSVTFMGRLPSGPAVWACLRRVDLFVMPSRTEGLPRAMIEAMAAGLPCIGTDAGGIPELIGAR